MKDDVLDLACRRLWGEIQGLCRRAATVETEAERLRARERLRELRALSARYREVQRREAWARWQAG